MTTVLHPVAEQPRIVRRDSSRVLGRMAIRSLYTELSLYPKPGLVSPVDNGAHDDMSMATFMRSLFSLRTYFVQIAAAGGFESRFITLKQLGMDAERRMLTATAGINTHRGAIFNLGLLSASAGYHIANRLPLDTDAICMTVATLWGKDLMADMPVDSNGSRAIARHGGPGAREQAALGYPVLRHVAVPTYDNSLKQSGDLDLAALQTFFALMSVLNDTNILHRAGREGLDYVHQQAREFLSDGGVFASGSIDRAAELHRAFSQRRISPGGAADLLSCAIFLHDVRADL